MPAAEGDIDFLNELDGQPVPSRTSANGVQSNNLTDMFLGQEKEHVVSFVARRKTPRRVDDSPRALLCGTARRHAGYANDAPHAVHGTRVFSPVYWLLLVLFPPLIFYYAARMSRNRNVSMPLASIDSVEKRYRANWLVFVLALIIGGTLVAAVQRCGHGGVGQFASTRFPGRHLVPLTSWFAGCCAACWARHCSPCC